MMYGSNPKQKKIQHNNKVFQLEEYLQQGEDMTLEKINTTNPESHRSTESKASPTKLLQKQRSWHTT